MIFLHRFVPLNNNNHKKEGNDPEKIMKNLLNEMFNLVVAMLHVQHLRANSQLR